MLFVLLLIPLLYGLYYYLTSTLDYWKKRKVLGPQPTPLFGNIYESVVRRKFMGDVIKDVYNKFPNEKVVGIYRMLSPALLLRDLDVIKQIWIKDFDTFPDRGIMLGKEGLGSNLFDTDGDTWRVLRNRFTPLFTSGKLKNMAYLMTDRAETFVQHVQRKVSEQPVQEIQQLVQKYTISTISACAFGIDMDIYNDEKIMKTLAEFDKSIFYASHILELDMLFPGILRKLNAGVYPKPLRDFFYNLTRTVISERKGAPIGRNDFMDLILELRQQGELKGNRKNDETELHLDFSEDVIAAQAFVFYAGGYETSATTMTFLLYELARNQDIQDKVLAEVDEILHKYEGKVTYDAISELKYLEKVFDETLRMYPVVDTLMRRAETDYKIPGLDIEIKKGQMVLVSALGIHHDPKYYPDPEKFDPERFSMENQKDRHSCAYLPFGAGPRNCIGMRFAKAQSRICMMALLRKFRVEMTKDTPTQVKFNPQRIITNPLGGMHLKLVPRS